MPHALIVNGGSNLSGEIRISGSKNSALPIIAACLLSDAPITLKNVPNLQDIHSMNQLLESLGAKIEFTIDHTRFDHNYAIDCSSISNLRADYDIVRKMRASILVLGSLLGRFGKAEVSLPGGCAIGARPVDMHLYAMQKLGAEIELRDGYVYAVAPIGGLVGAVIPFDKVSVGATENAIMAGVLANGVTQIENAACEPEILDLCNFLNEMGAKITGAGTHTIIIEGVKFLKQTSPYRVIADRVEAGTYAIMAAATASDFTLTHMIPSHLTAVLAVLKEAGVDIEVLEDRIKVRGTSSILHGRDIQTQPYPGFPTDLQAQFLTLMGISKGSAKISEKIFENRFMHVPELIRMGADMKIDGESVMVTGVERYKAAEVMATDLRASVSLLIAALNANGETTINRIYHLDRGYEALEKKLAACGARLRRVSE
jgi:UDP-N-acetylglucosamine 1-carboxyvinyltransferase